MLTAGLAFSRGLCFLFGKKSVASGSFQSATPGGAAAVGRARSRRLPSRDGERQSVSSQGTDAKGSAERCRCPVKGSGSWGKPLRYVAPHYTTSLCPSRSAAYLLPPCSGPHEAELCGPHQLEPWFSGFPWGPARVEQQQESSGEGSFLGPCPTGLQRLPGDPLHTACSTQVLETISFLLSFKLGALMEPHYY